MVVKVEHGFRREHDGYIQIKIIYGLTECRTYIIYCEDVDSKMEEYEDPESGLILIDRQNRIFALKYDKDFWDTDIII